VGILQEGEAVVPDPGADGRLYSKEEFNNPSGRKSMLVIRGTGNRLIQQLKGATEE
jgi:hypothetical protein